MNAITDKPLPTRRERRAQEAAAAAAAAAAAGTTPTEAMPAVGARTGQPGPSTPAQQATPFPDFSEYAASEYAASQYAAAGHASAPSESSASGAGTGGDGPRRTRRDRRKPEREPLGPIRGTIRTFGELCITAGLVLILFVVWQLWWTDIEANHDNEVLANELTQDWSGQDPNQLPDDPDTPVVAKPVAKNTPFGIFYIPRFGGDFYRTMAEGVDLEPVLNRMGVGHYPTSAMPGEKGNFAVAGHRVTYGKPFNQIAQLRPGDQIIVQTKDGFYTYTFRNFDIILPDAVEVLSPVPSEPKYKGKDRILTMTACNPMFSARERYVAYAELTDWTPAGKGVPDSIKDSKAYKAVSKQTGGA